MSLKHVSPQKPVMLQHEKVVNVSNIFFIFYPWLDGMPLPPPPAQKSTSVYNCVPNIA